MRPKGFNIGRIFGTEERLKARLRDFGAVCRKGASFSYPPGSGMSASVHISPLYQN